MLAEKSGLGKNLATALAMPIESIVVKGSAVRALTYLTDMQQMPADNLFRLPSSRRCMAASIWE